MEYENSNSNKNTILLAVIAVAVIVFGVVLTVNVIGLGGRIDALEQKLVSVDGEVSQINDNTFEIYELLDGALCDGSGSADLPDVPYWLEDDDDDPRYSIDKPNIYIYPDDEEVDKKPVVYVYPDKPAVEVSVALTTQHDMIATYPNPDTVTDNTYEWNVYAMQDGTLYDKANNEYSYIFWEAVNHDLEHDFSKGFCVKGEDTVEFLCTTLAEIGLTPKEYNEFIVYWLPKMQDNLYNLITFEGIDKDDAYNKAFALNVSDTTGKEADSMLRVMMAWKSVDEYVEIEPQTFETFERNGFTVVEWGGCEVK